MENEKQNLTPSAEASHIFGSALNSTIELRNLPSGVDNLQPSEQMVDENTVQSRRGNEMTTNMESSTSKRVVSLAGPDLQAGEIDSAVVEARPGVKKMKLNHQIPISHTQICPLCNVPHERGLSISLKSGSKHPNWGEIILHVFKVQDEVKKYNVSSVLLDDPKGPCVVFLASRDQACSAVREFSAFNFQGDDYQLNFWYNRPGDERPSTIGTSKTTPPSSENSLTSQTSNHLVDPNATNEPSQGPSSAETVQPASQDPIIPIEKRLQSRNKLIYQALNENRGLQVLLKLNEHPALSNEHRQKKRDSLRLIWLYNLYAKCNSDLSMIYEVVGKKGNQRLRFFLVFESPGRKEYCQRQLSGCKIKIDPSSKTTIPIEFTDHDAAVGLKTTWSAISREDLKATWSKITTEELSEVSMQWNPEATLDSHQDVVQEAEAGSNSGHAKSAPRTIDTLPIQELELQTRYFGPLTGTDLARCRCCGIAGHLSEDCPSRTCLYCRKVDDHFSNSCPAIQRCFKCREAGHTSATCPSKLKRSMAADGIVCQLCKSNDHGEESCPTRWTTYRPQKDPADIHRVQSLQSACYQCGSDQHWGDDCRFGPHRNIVRGPFSLAYASQFLLPDRHEHTREFRASANEGVDNDFLIMGKGRAERRKPSPAIRISLQGPASGPNQRPWRGPNENSYQPANQPGMSRSQHFYETPSTHHHAPANIPRDPTSVTLHPHLHPVSMPPHLATVSMPQHLAPVSMPPYLAPGSMPPYLAPVSMPPHLAPVTMPPHLAPAGMQLHGNQPGALPQPPLPKGPPPPFYSFGDGGQRRS